MIDIDDESVQDAREWLDAMNKVVQQQASAQRLAAQQLLRYGGHIEAECKAAHDGSPCTCGWVDVLRLVLRDQQEGAL